MNDWFRSWHGAPTNSKWLTIAKRASVPTHLVVALAWTLLDRASIAEDRGSIAGADPETMAVFLGCEASDVERVMLAMEEKGFLSGDRLGGWERRQPKREREDDGAAERQRAKRARDKDRPQDGGGSGAAIAPRHATSRQGHANSRLDADADADADASSLRSEAGQAQAQELTHAEARGWLGPIVGETPVALDVDMTPILVLLEDPIITRADVEAGIRDALVKCRKPVATWAKFEGWIRTAAKNRLVAQPRASPGLTPQRTDLLAAARRGAAIGEARAAAKRQEAQDRRMEAVG